MGLHTGKEHLEQGSKGVLRGARQEGQTGEVTIDGPERTGLSTSRVSLALIGRVATSPLPLPCHHVSKSNNYLIASNFTSSLATLNGKHFVFGLWIF